MIYYNSEQVFIITFREQIYLITTYKLNNFLFYISPQIMSMNDCGEPQLSSVITARLDHIYKCTLHIQVLCKFIVILLFVKIYYLFIYT